eukprot:GHVR01006019.1.p1 GENE.GHVR01006019.1~~GHVR01006019.1.p1  ORF type:complete len:320 (+),score=70.30 GHVR01006019.1:143-1102(+)
MYIHPVHLHSSCSVVRGMICAPGRIPGTSNRYLLPKLKKVFEVNHSTQSYVLDSLTDADPLIFSGPTEPYRLALEAALEEYVTHNYPPDTLSPLPPPLPVPPPRSLTNVTVQYNILPVKSSQAHTHRENHLSWGVYPIPPTTTSTHDKRHYLSVTIAARFLNLRNFWGSSWSSEWSVGLTFDKDKLVSASIDGTIEVCAHHFEDGNVQLRSNKDISINIDDESVLSSPESIALKFTTIVGSVDTSVQERVLTCTLHSTDVAMSAAADVNGGGCIRNEGVLRECRRVFPINCEKFDWSPVRHMLVKDLFAATSNSNFLTR